MHLPIKRYVVLLRQYLRPQVRQVMLLAVCLLLGIGLQLLNPRILQYFIDTALAQGPTLSLVYAGLLFIAIALVNQGLAIATTYFGTNIAWTATNYLRNDLLEHCLGLDMSFHKTRTPGEMIERIDGDVDDLSNFFSEFVLNLLTNFLLLAGILVIFFLINWIAGVAITLFSAIMFAVLIYMRRKVVALWKAERQMSATFYGFLGEHLGGTEDIRANGATGYTLRQFHMILRSWFPVRRRAVLIGTISGAFTLFMFIAGSAMAVAIGVYLWSIKAATVGTVVAMFTYMDLLSQPIQEIQEQLQDLQQASACIDRTEELLQMTSSLSDGTQTLPDTAVMAEAPDIVEPAQALQIDFAHVTFGYVADEPVIHDLSLSLQPGRVLGVLGRTGSGKTTLARLLFRLYDPQEGEVLINGIAAQQFQLRNLRRNIGMVTQDVQLFRATVRENLTLFRREISDELILAALKEIGLDGWYIGLPEGLDSMMGADGEGLSAGEAQLLAFARVLLTNPGLIILDEASSRLDPATEGVIEHAMSTLFAGRTAIVIAHRLATIQRVDDIVIIEDGRMLEYGPRSQLVNDPHSHFAELLRTGLEDVEVHA